MHFFIITFKKRPPLSERSYTLSIIMIFSVIVIGYISSKLFEKLYVKDITLITRIKKNMKDKLILTSIGDLISFVAYIPYQKH